MRPPNNNSATTLNMHLMYLLATISIHQLTLGTVGQGAGDACPWWIVQVNSLTLAYLTKAQMWHLTSPDATTYVQQGFDMFVDNTNLLSVAVPKQSALVPIYTAQENVNLRNALLQASGGELNPSKCVWFHFFWQSNLHGMIHLTTPPDTTPSLLLVVHNQPLIPIKCLAPLEVHCYLGVDITTNGDNCTKLQMFQQCNAHVISLLCQCPFPYSDITVIYKQCYLPTVSYPLLATSMPVAKVWLRENNIRIQCPSAAKNEIGTGIS